VGMPLGDGKASVLDEQARLAKYITTHEDETPSLSVEGVVGSLLAQRQNTNPVKTSDALSPHRVPRWNVCPRVQR